MTGSLDTESLIQGCSPLDLSGDWRFQLDPAGEGLAADWQNRILPDCIQIPGTTDTRCKGVENPERHLRQLTRRWLYVGAAWYQREIEIPGTWGQSRVRLFIERCKPSRVWVDGVAASSIQTSVYTPHLHDLGRLSPGRHVVTVLIDNAHPLPVSGHALSEATQTNWNGMIGRVELQQLPDVRIEKLRSYADFERKTLYVVLSLERRSEADFEGELGVLVRDAEEASELQPLFLSKPIHSLETGLNEVVLQVLMPAVRRWDEHAPHLFRVEVSLCGRAGDLGIDDRRQLQIGFAGMRREGGSLTLHGRRLFLRGKHDCCAFPETGHPPMEQAWWDRYFATCREYGLNHVRFHSWTPPEAAFAAADRAGIYLLPELPFWGVLPDPSQPGLETYLREEGIRILDTYGNHPSLCLFSVGNETGGKREALAALVAELRAHDERPLYASGTNPFFNNPAPQPGDDFWVTMRTRLSLSGRTRASYSHADLPLGHIETEGPGTRHDFSQALAGVELPLIGHETGQYQFYPDYDEIARYTGVLAPRNLEQYAERLRQAGLWERRKEFFAAAGALALRCYREDIEAALRTPGWSGFQLLDLQDYPGQGTALIGILNVFMESKGLIQPEEWRSFCSERVLLARFDRAVWMEGETFQAELELANYGPDALETFPVAWSLLDERGQVLRHGTFSVERAAQGALVHLGRIQFGLEGLACPGKFQLMVGLPDLMLVNSYDLWVYPKAAPLDIPSSLRIASALDAETLAQLEAGERVLLFPELSHLKNSLGGLFMTDFWCYPMFKRVCDQYGIAASPGTMGLCCRPGHAALKGFPNDGHSDWQWWHLIKASRPMILNEAPAGLEPIITVIDNFDRNHRLALAFECRVGRGRLLVSSIDMDALAGRPEAEALFRSLVSYAASSDFEPTQTLDAEQLHRLLYVANPAYDESPREMVQLTAEEAAQGPGAAVLG